MKDDWVKAAMSDDLMVAELLFRLKQQQSSLSSSEFRKPLPPSPSTSLPFIPQGWGRHQPRSRFSVCVNGNTGKKDSVAAGGTNCSTIRRSPTTPLSWSGGGGGGGGASCSAASPSDGNCDGQSEPDRAFSDLSRSKDECTNISSTSKSFGKRKAMFVLEDEDTLGLKESIHLSKKSKLVSRTVVSQQQEQRSRRQNSKTIKFDTIIQRLEKEMVETPGSPSMTKTAATALTGRVEPEKYRSSPKFNAEHQHQQQQHKRCILLPDLNAIPEGDDI